MEYKISNRLKMSAIVLIVLGLLVLFLSPLAKIAAGIAIAYGAWTIYKKD